MPAARQCAVTGDTHDAPSVQLADTGCLRHRDCRLALRGGCRVPAGRISDIVRGRRSITPDTASRPAVYFGTSPDLWINLQARYDAKIAANRIVPRVAKQIRPRAA